MCVDADILALETKSNIPIDIYCFYVARCFPPV